MTKLLLSITLLFSVQIIFAQENLSGMPAPIQPIDFKLASQISDTGAAAVVLFDSSSCILTANPQRGFYTIYHHLRRILILRKEALSPGDYDVGTQTIFYNKEYNGDKKLKSLRISTYNLENGQVVRTVLPDKDIYVTTDKKKDNYVELKFAYPSAKEGSIVEMEYTKDNYSTDLLDWYFQGHYPVVKKIYTAAIPEIWSFVITTQNNKYITNIRKDSTKKNIYSWQYNYEDVTCHSLTWTAENIPALKIEPFTSTYENYIGCVKFQLSVQPVSPGHSERLFHNWEWTNNRLLLNANFGTQIDVHSNSWAGKIVKEKLGEGDNNLTLARKIFILVRDNFKSSGSGLTMSNYNMKAAYESRLENSAGINLTLILMLRSQKFKADPVILSTRDNGLTYADYPILDKYNYTICRLEIDRHVYYLDASDRKIGFGRLPAECYNGHARVITKEGFSVYLNADSIKESTSSFANVEYDSVSKSLVLNCSQTIGYYESLDIRHKLDNETLAKYIKSITGTKTPEGTIDSISFSDLDSLDRPISFFYTYETRNIKF